jgi:hypothetical protein
MAKRAKAQPAIAKKINAVFLFDITKDGKPAAKWSECCCGVFFSVLFGK